MEKTEALIQAAGEAEYVNDLPVVQGELHAAFVLTSMANCEIASIDPKQALVRFLFFKLPKTNKLAKNDFFFSSQLIFFSLESL